MVADKVAGIAYQRLIKTKFVKEAAGLALAQLCMTVKAAVAGGFRKRLARIVQQESQRKPKIKAAAGSLPSTRRLPSAGRLAMAQCLHCMFPDIAFGMKFLGMIHIIQSGQLRPKDFQNTAAAQKFKPPIRPRRNHEADQKDALGLRVWEGCS